MTPRVRVRVIFLCVLLTGLCTAAHPACEWVCNVPVCAAVCAPVCTPANCSVICAPSGTDVTCQPADCWNECPSDQSETDGCPECTVQCAAPQCQTLGPDPPQCDNMCQAPTCTWSCVKPSLAACPAPVCALQCEAPACEGPAPPSSDGAVAVTMSWCSLALLLLVVVYYDEK